MNIAVDTQYSAREVTRTDTTTTYKAAAEPTKTWGSGYLLDIADKVMDDEAYQGQGMTADDIMQQAQSTDVEAQKNFMLVMSNSVSGEDLEKMAEEGFDPRSTDVETYVSIVDQIKVTLAKAGVEIEGYNDDLDRDTVIQVTGSEISANDLANMLAQSDLPITEYNVEQIVQAADKAMQIGELSEDAMKFLVRNRKPPTIENLYLAQHASAAGSNKQSQGYYSNGIGSHTGYYAKKADTINWSNLQKQIEKQIEQAGLEDSEQAYENAKWLIESGIELNSQNLTYMAELGELELPLSQEDALTITITAMSNGKAPMKALMTGEISIAEQAQQILEEVESLSGETIDAAIEEVVKEGAVINIKNLTAAQKKLEAKQALGEKPQEQQQTEEAQQEEQLTQKQSSQSLQEIQAKRQIEEIRLMMTQEANQRLLKSGFQIDTAQLSELVEALKETEAAIKQALFQGENEQVNEERAALYQDTLAKTKELAAMPAAVVVKAAASTTLEILHQEGTNLKERYDKAQTTYETLMTAPRKDMGDSIRKAFRNVDAILEDMNLETSESNRRAVRILGYNSMDITEENIETVKQADSQVRSVMRKMTPANTLQMIRDQKNPLTMSLDDLEEYFGEQDAAQDAEKFSKYLQKLDQNKQITAQEKEAYIGIYRMFRQIEKSDGAVIGSVVAAGAEMNFKNMLSAVRTNARKNMDITIDESFGGLEQLLQKGSAIDTQIETGFSQMQQEQSQEESAYRQDDQYKKQCSYYAQQAQEIQDELALQIPADKMTQIEPTAETTIEEFADSLKQLSAPAAKDAQQQAEKAESERMENLHRHQQTMQTAEQINESVIQALIDYEQPVSVDNLQAAELLLMQRGELYRQIFGRSTASGEAADTGEEAETEQQIEIEKETGQEVWEAADHFVDRLTNAKEAASSYQELVSQATKLVDTSVYTGNNKIDIKAARALYKGLSLTGNLAREENYEIPVYLKGELTSVNLKIYHNAAQRGKVTVTMDSSTLGKVAAEFDVTKDKITGLLAYESADTNAAGKELKTLFEQELEQLSSPEESGKQTVTVSLAGTKKLDLNRFGQDRELFEEGEAPDTSYLYRTAKAFMLALKEYDTQGQ